jgi:hypothetical protein
MKGKGGSCKGTKGMKERKKERVEEMKIRKKSFHAVFQRAYPQALNICHSYIFAKMTFHY